MTAADAPSRPTRQLLHLVFGGELKSLEDLEFANLDELDIIGMYPSYAEAYKAWKAVAHRRQRADALLHRPPASPSGSQRHGAATFVTSWPSTLARCASVGSVASLRPSW